MTVTCEGHTAIVTGSTQVLDDPDRAGSAARIVLLTAHRLINVELTDRHWSGLGDRQHVGDAAARRGRPRPDAPLETPGPAGSRASQRPPMRRLSSPSADRAAGK